MENWQIIEHLWDQQWNVECCICGKWNDIGDVENYAKTHSGVIDELSKNWVCLGCISWAWHTIIDTNNPT